VLISNKNYVKSCKEKADIHSIDSTVPKVAYDDLSLKEGSVLRNISVEVDTRILLVFVLKNSSEFKPDVHDTVLGATAGFQQTKIEKR
jgi:hypothetical protein